MRAVHVSESEDDPAGDDDPSASCVENMLATIDVIRADAAAPAPAQ